MSLLEQAQVRLERETVLAERSRIAREPHDIVSHGLASIVVRAGVARALTPADPGQTSDVVAVIEQVARDSLAEMRRMLGALRSFDDDAEGGEPQPGLHRLDELVEAARGGAPGRDHPMWDPTSPAAGP